MVEIQAEEKKIFDEIQMSPTDEAAKDQAKIQTEKELALKELKLKAKVQAHTSAAADPPPRNRDATSLHR